MSKIKIVHVDDSLDQLLTIQYILKNFENVELLQQFSKAEDGANYILQHEVDLAIIDIEMPEKDGFWLADQIKGTKTLIVFLTSHTQYTLQAFEACAIHYMLKPASVTTLNNMLERYRKFKPDLISNLQHQSAQINELINNYVSTQNYPSQIFINNHYKTSIINLDKLEYIAASGSYTVFKMENAEQFTASKLLKTYEESLAKHPDFIRVHRGYIINKK